MEQAKKTLETEMRERECVARQYYQTMEELDYEVCNMSAELKTMVEHRKPKGNIGSYMIWLASTIDDVKPVMRQFGGMVEDTAMRSTKLRLGKDMVVHLEILCRVINSAAAFCNSSNAEDDGAIGDSSISNIMEMVVPQIADISRKVCHTIHDVIDAIGTIERIQNDDERMVRVLKNNRTRFMRENSELLNQYVDEVDDVNEEIRILNENSKSMPQIVLHVLYNEFTSSLATEMARRGVTEMETLPVLLFFAKMKWLKERRRGMMSHETIDNVPVDDRDRRFAYAVRQVMAEGQIKYGYDWTWIEQYCEGHLDGCPFSSSQTFLDYIALLGVKLDVGRTSLAKKQSCARGSYPAWTFTDTDKAGETARRITLVGRFIFHYNKYSR